MWLLDVCEHREITTVANDRLALTSQLLREEEKLKLSVLKNLCRMHLLFIYDLPKKNEMPHWYRLSDKCFLSSVSVGCVFVKFAHFDTHVQTFST